MAKEHIDVSVLPQGLTKKELINRPELKNIKSWFTWAGIVQIVTGVANFVTIGQLAELQAQGYQVNENYMMLLAVISVIFVGLGIALLVTKSTVIAYIVGGTGILMAIAALATGGTVGAGIIAVVLAIVGAVRFENIWKQYSSNKIM